MTPILSTCLFSYMYSICLLENGSTYTAIRKDEHTLEVFIDWKIEYVIYKGKVTYPEFPWKN